MGAEYMGIPSIASSKCSSPPIFLTMSSEMTYAQELLAEAKINTCVPEIVEDLSEVCAIFAKTHGEDAVECAEPFLLYGKALLEMSKIESAVLGNAFEGFEHEVVVEEKPDFSQVENHESLSKAEMEEIDENVWEAFEDNYDQHEMVARLHLGEEEFDEESDEEDYEEEEPETEGNPDGDDVGHLELAWEMLELAKSISAKCGKTDMEAVALHYLGEVSLESNNYTQAIEDLTKAANIKTKTAPSDSRALAETHYQLGVAHAWAGNFPLAEKCLSDASAVLEKRMVSHPTEKEELASIVNDIKGRIAEHKDMEKGVFNDTYVKAPGGKIMSGLGVAGAVESGKPVAIGTVGTA